MKVYSLFEEEEGKGSKTPALRRESWPFVFDALSGSGQDGWMDGNSVLRTTTVLYCTDMYCTNCEEEVVAGYTDHTDHIIQRIQRIQRIQTGCPVHSPLELPLSQTAFWFVLPWWESWAGWMHRPAVVVA
jgi:hypothetical protein